MRILLYYYIGGLIIGILSTAMNIYATQLAKTSSGEIFAIVCAIITALISVFYIVRIYRYFKYYRNQ